MDSEIQSQIRYDLWLFLHSNRAHIETSQSFFSLHSIKNAASIKQKQSRTLLATLIRHMEMKLLWRLQLPRSVRDAFDFSLNPLNHFCIIITFFSTGPVSVSVDGYYPEFQFYKSGIYNEKRYCKYDFFLNYYLLAVGYGTKELSKCPDNEDYWILKNSWGTSWGMDGYILLRRNYHDMCGVADFGMYPVMLWKTFFWFLNS